MSKNQNVEGSLSDEPPVNTDIDSKDNKGSSTADNSLSSKETSAEEKPGRPTVDDLKKFVLQYHGFEPTDIPDYIYKQATAGYEVKVSKRTMARIAINLIKAAEKEAKKREKKSGKTEEMGREKSYKYPPLDNERVFDIEDQKNWLDKLWSINKEALLVKALDGEVPEDGDPELYRWTRYQVIWDRITQPIWTRGILKNELMLDPDVKDWDILKIELDVVKAFCEKEDIPLQLAYSGGNGIHGHIFFHFDIPAELKADIKTYDVDIYQYLRKTLVDILFEESGADRNALCIDTKKINFSADKKGSQVRDYGTLRENGNCKTLISEIPDKKPGIKELPLVFPEEIKLWTVPEKYYPRIIEELTTAIDVAKEYRNFNVSGFTLSGCELEKDFICVKKLLRIGASKGSRYYGALSMALLGKKCNYPYDKIKEMSQKFLEDCGIKGSELNQRMSGIERGYKDSTLNFSCRSMKEIFGEDICSFMDCKMSEKVRTAKKSKEEIPKEIKNKAEDILKNGNPIEYVMSVYNKLHMGDEVTGKVILAAIGSQCVLNSSGIQPKLSGTSGKGKSHAVSSMLHLMPPEYVIETSLSDKVAYYLSLKPGTIIYSDDVEVSENLQGTIKRATTKFQDKTKHTVVIKKNGELVPVTMNIPERIIWLFTSVNDNGGMEYLNRQFNLSVDESVDNDFLVMKHILAKVKDGSPDFPLTEEVQICRAIFADLKKQLFTVRIPYAEDIKWANPENRRNLSQFLDFVMAFAIFHYKNRKQIGARIIEASEEDFYSAVRLYSPRANNQKTKLNDREIQLLLQMTKDTPYTIPELQETLKMSYQTVYHLFHGRDKKSGLLEKVPELEYHPETEYEKDIEGVTTKTKPKNVYILTRSYNEMFNLNVVALLVHQKTEDIKHT
ncbi:MAG: hypothetical protein FIB07_17950 [Candidatus Methanoperedens sp.]|nr:hypothetical protein [Candidatus Methanoperedens sp.]